MKNIIVYTSNTCPYCKMVKDYLQSKSMPFQERNISTDVEAQKELIKKGLRSIPVISIEGYEDIIGFDRYRLDQIIG